MLIFFPDSWKSSQNQYFRAGIVTFVMALVPFTNIMVRLEKYNETMHDVTSFFQHPSLLPTIIAIYLVVLYHYMAFSIVTPPFPPGYLSKEEREGLALAGSFYYSFISTTLVAHRKFQLVLLFFLLCSTLSKKLSSHRR
jgi:hypothetical protein